MKTANHTPSLLLFFFLFCSLATAQRGIVTGVLGDETGPLPGATVVVKGTNTGTETDFDGNYSIECQVGDILVFTFVGMTTKEVKVTPALFGNDPLRSTLRQEPVRKILSNDYLQALKSTVDSTAINQGLLENGYTYNKRKTYFEAHRIKNIKETNRKLKITYFKPDILYQIVLNSNLSFHFVDKNNLPKLQQTFAQGKPFNGSNQWFGPETNTPFSFGPQVNTLAFDGSNYNYDTNGRLINGTAQNQQLPYNNNIFETGILLSNNLNLAVSNNIHSVDLNALKSTQEDLFDAERSNRTQFDINYDFKKMVSAFFKTSVDVNKQPNTNGFINNLLLASYVTPSSFQNSQGYQFNDLTQRSFSPTQFNNPQWLLQLNQNQSKATASLFGIKSDLQLGEELTFNTIISYTNEQDQLDFALPRQTVDFEDGYRSKKNFSDKTLHAYAGINYDFGIRNFSEVTLRSSLKYKHMALDYRLLEQSDFADLSFDNAANETRVAMQLSNNTLRMVNELKFTLNTDFPLHFTLMNNAVSSGLQGTELLLPSAQVYVDLVNLIGYPDWMSTFSIAAAVAKEAKEMPLYYSNQSHNSLTIDPQASSSLLANNDLFNNKGLAFETATNFDIETNLRLFYNTINMSVNYYHSKTDNSIFPVFTNGAFELQNIAAVKNQGLEATVSANIGRDHDNFKYVPTFIFSKNRGAVQGLHGALSSIPIAGFRTISKDLIVGEQTGTLVGSAYLRNADGAVVIDTDGYPSVDTEKQIIGNTTPDFNLSMENFVKIGKFRLNFLLDFQKGGDVWNGTKTVLNYTGRSQESANLRGTTNFIFEGVTQSGTINTTPVNFANPAQDISENRWVRYGVNGVDEETIVDGSFLNLKSISVSYDFAEGKRYEFFRQLKLSLYANNLISYTKANGISPYTSLFDYSAGKGLAYFNMPLVKEIGFKLNIKI